MAATPRTPASSKQVNAGKTSPDAVQELDKAIADVLLEIKNLDKGIKSLNERRMMLTAKYEQLNETRQMHASEAIATEQNWESGKLDKRITRNECKHLINIFHSFSIVRIVQLVGGCPGKTDKRVQTAQISTATIANDKLHYGEEGRADDRADRWGEKFVLPIAGNSQRRSDRCHFPAHLADGRSGVVAEEVRNRCRTAVGRHRQKSKQFGAETNDGEIQCV